LKNSIYDFTAYPIPDSENFHSIVSGDNQRHILIGFVNEQRDELEVFLKKIISAAKIELEKDCLILRGDADIVSLPSFSQLRSQHKIEKVVLFGIKGKDMGFNIETPLYIPFEFNFCQFLFADKLSAIENSLERKKALWSALQTLFY
jgi:hypothetical protein